MGQPPTSHDVKPWLNIYVLLSSQLSELLGKVDWSILKNRRIQNGVMVWRTKSLGPLVPWTARFAIAPSLQKCWKKKQGGFNAKNAARRPDMWCLSDGSVSSDFGEYPMGSHFWHKPISMWRRPESYNVVPPTCVCWFINPSNYSYFIIITWLNLVINPLSQLYIVPTYRYGLIINGGNDNLSFGGNSGRWKKQLVICWFIFIQSISIYIYPDN